jgi:UDP-glucose 4-epimerase
MVFERATEFPTPEGAERSSPPPLSTYGFQKLACEYFARGAHLQSGLPYTIVRPFNCVGVGEPVCSAPRTSAPATSSSR